MAALADVPGGSPSHCVPSKGLSVARCLIRQLMLGNNDVARCDFVWRQPGFKRHLPGRLPDDADDSASLRSYAVQLVPESHWLVADRMDSVLLASDTGPPSGSRM
jgi:hypothetical protein